MSRQENLSSMHTTSHINVNRNTSFRDVWRKAIEKYSPKKPEKLNEVSKRFRIKRDQQERFGF